MNDIRTADERALARRNYIIFCTAVVISMTAFTVGALKLIGAF